MGFVVASSAIVVFRDGSAVVLDIDVFDGVENGVVFVAVAAVVVAIGVFAVDGDVLVIVVLEIVVVVANGDDVDGTMVVVDIKRVVEIILSGLVVVIIRGVGGLVLAVVFWVVVVVCGDVV